MSDGQPISTMSTYTARTWTAGEDIDANKLNDGSTGEFNSIDALIDQVKVALADIQSCRSVSGHAPTDNTTAGQIVHDPDNDTWYGDPDGSGADDEFLTRLKAYGIDLATGGTATLRLGGAINVDTTQVPLTAAGVLESYTLPGGTLARNGQYIHTIMAGTKTGTTADASIQIRFNTGVQHTFTLDDNATDWCIEWWIIRTGAATQKFFAYMVMNRDDTGKTDIAKYGTDDETLANPLAIDANLSAVTSDTVTKEIMICEFGNY